MQAEEAGSSPYLKAFVESNRQWWRKKDLHVLEMQQKARHVVQTWLKVVAHPFPVGASQTALVGALEMVLGLWIYADPQIRGVMVIQREVLLVAISPTEEMLDTTMVTVQSG